jgi:probable HAF family extracellular repeat protein
MNLIKFSGWTIAGLCLAAWATQPQVTPIPKAQAGTDARPDTVYRVQHFASLGGNSSRGNVMLNRGWVAGYSQNATDTVRRATLWINGEPHDLGTLGGASSHSNVPWHGLNNRGTVVGIAETGEPDPRGEIWSCTTFFFPAVPSGESCLAFAWRAGEMRPLPTFGGNNGFATAVNNRNQAVGWAENEVEDPSCNPPQVLQFRAALWDLDTDTLEELPPLGGDSTSAATAINDQGQVVGISGDCANAVGSTSARHAVMWDNGQVIDLGALGSPTFNTPMGINAAGDVVGFADDPEGEFSLNLRAVLWPKGQEIQNLGLLPGHAHSQAHAINARGQVVGVSFGGGAPQRAVIWENGKLSDLNDLVEPGYAGTLVDARDINERGEITGFAFDPVSGALVTYVATPIRSSRAEF